MKQKFHILILILFFSPYLKAQDKYQINWSYKDLSFREFVTKAESLMAVRFYFKDDWVSGLKLNEYSGCNKLSCVLDNLFNGTELHYYIDESGNIVVTKNFAVKIFSGTGKAQDNFIPQSVPGDIGKGPEKEETRVVEVGNPSDKGKSGLVTISGYIVSRDTKEAAAGVTISIQKLLIGTVSNQFGFYTLTLPRGNHLILFSFFGMKEKKINLHLYSTGEMNVEMNSILIPLKEVFVSNQKNLTLQRFEVGAEKINMSSFKLLPTSLGERDILKSLTLVPGVQSVGEGSAGFNVRGGSADQNLILLYGAPIYNSSHFFGFFSAINSDIIKDVTLYKGGIPSRYGGRISSVLDIESKEGNREEFAGNAGISPVTTHLKVEGPIIKDTLTYLVTARTTYSNWIFGLINDPQLHNSRASFYDLNAKMTYNLNKENKIDVSSYLSHDSFRLNSSTEYNYDNRIIALKWLHFYNSKFFSAFSINNSFYKYNIINRDISSEAYVLSHNINSTGFKADFNWFRGKNEINFGFDANRYSVIPGNIGPASDTSLVVSNNIPREVAFEGALYIDDKFTLTKFLSVNAGLRMSLFFSLGPKTVFTYEPNFTKSSSDIVDTLYFRSGKISSKYAGPELRISLNFRISEKNSVKINYNRTRQYIHLLSNSTAISPTDTWKLSDYYLKPEIGNQYALGFYRMLLRNRIEASVEVYFKEIQNMIDFKGGSTLTMAGNIEQYMIDMKGKAYGMELSLKKNEGKLRYSLGYTYSRTFVKSISGLRDEIINSGNWYPANYDKPNDLIVTFQYIYSRRLSFSADYTYSTGRPITIPIATYRVSDIKMLQYSDRNEYRIPDYSRFDFSMNLSGNLKSHKIAHPLWTFSVYNLFGRENAYSVYFKKVGEVVKGYKLSVFGRAVSTVTFSFDF